MAADTLPNTSIPANQWVDIYSLTGIAVGAMIAVQNVGVCDIWLNTGLNAPSPSDPPRFILERSQMARNDPGDSGAWAYCRTEGKINVWLPS